MEAEGKAMHHCVGGYHRRKDSLILSATIDGKRIETIEVSLTTLKVVQSRGYAIPTPSTTTASSDLWKTMSD